MAWRGTRLNQSSCLLGPLAGEDGVTELREQRKHWGSQKKSESRWQVDESMKHKKALYSMAVLSKDSCSRQAVTGTQNKKGRAGSREGQWGKSKGRARGLHVQLLTEHRASMHRARALDQCRESWALDQCREFWSHLPPCPKPSTSLLPYLGFFFYICKSNEVIQMFSEHLFSSLCGKPSCFCGMMLRKIFSIFTSVCF